MTRISMAIVAAALSAAGCNRADNADAASELSSTGVDDKRVTRSAAAVEVPDACTFMTKEEMAEIVGRELREGDPNSQPEGISECDFETPPGLYVTRTYPDPALPEASGFSSVTINTHPTSAATFKEFRDMLGNDGEDVRGVGDGAYFYGPALLYVRVGDAGFTIRLHVNEPTTDNGKARLRAVMLALANRGVSKLQ